ncbi:MAG: pilus assembly protein PilM [Candidatus Muiribacteriota bacterium]
MKIDIDIIVNNFKKSRIYSNLFSEEDSCKKYIIYDIGSNSIKAVFVEITDKINILDCKNVKINTEKYGDYEKALEAALKDIIYGKSVESYKVIIILSGQYILNRFVILPKIPDDELDSALKFEIKKILHTDMKNVFYNYKIVETLKDEKEKEKYKIFVGVVREEDISLLEKLFKKFGMIINNVTIDSLLYADLYKKMGEHENSVAFIDIGSENTNFNIVKNGILEFSRNIPMGGNAITELIAKDISGSPTNFREYIAESEVEKKKTVVYSDENEMEKLDERKKIIALSLVDGISRIIQRIRLTIGYYKTQVKGQNVSKLFITGGTSSIGNIESFFVKHLDTETFKIDNSFLNEFNFEDELSKNKMLENSSVYWLTVCCILQLNSKGSVINFYQKNQMQKINADFFINLFPEPKKVFGLAAGLICLYYSALMVPQYFTTKALYNSYIRVDNVVKNYRSIDNEVKYSLKIFNANNKNVVDWVNEFKIAKKDWIDFFRFISETMPDNSYTYNLNLKPLRQFAPAKQQLTIEFEFEGYENLREFQYELKISEKMNEMFKIEKMEFKERMVYTRDNITYYRLIMEAILI